MVFRMFEVFIVGFLFRQSLGLEQVVEVVVVQQALDQVTGGIHTEEPHHRAWNETEIGVAGVDADHAQRNHRATDNGFGEQVIQLIVIYRGRFRTHGALAFH